MVAKLVIAALLFAVFLAVVIRYGFQYIENEAQRRHERKLHREQRDYETIIEYAEQDTSPEPDEGKDKDKDKTTENDTTG